VGTLEAAAWSGIHEEHARIFSKPGAQKFWKLIRGVFSPDFVEFAERAVRTAD